MFTVRKLMKGYTFTDLSEEYGQARNTFITLFERACGKIKAANDAQWEKVHGVCLQKDVQPV